MSKRAALRHHLNAARTVQTIYMPSIAQKVAEHRRQLAASIPSHPSSAAPVPRRLPAAAIDKLDLPEHQPLFLPNELEEHNLDACVAGLAEIESRLRDGQLTDSLDKLRVHLHIRSRLVQFKDRNICHQAPNTRTRTKIAQNEAKINANKEKYRAVRQAKLSLISPGLWEYCWKVLADKDVVTMRGDDEVVGVGTSEGKRELSWIWKSADDDRDVKGIRGLSDGA